VPTEWEAGLPDSWSKQFGKRKLGNWNPYRVAHHIISILTTLFWHPAKELMEG